MQLSQLGIRTRIYGGFGSLLALGLVLTIIALWALFSINREVTKMDVSSDDTAQLREVSRDIETMRTTVQRNNLGAQGRAIGENAARDALQHLQAAGKATQSDERRRIYQDLQQEIVAFGDQRTKWSGLSSQLQGEMEKLFSDGDELAAGSERLFAAAHAGADQSATALAGEAEAAVLLVRVANWRFLATREPTGPATFKSNLVKARAAMAELENASLPSEVRALIAPVTATLDRYAASFELAATDFLKINEVHDDRMVP